jgi:FtsZ-binding cell division protein ZapB
MIKWLIHQLQVELEESKEKRNEKSTATHSGQSQELRQD